MIHARFTRVASLPTGARDIGGMRLDGIEGAKPVDRAHWYAIWTRSHCEDLVADQLRAHGHTIFLPKIVTWARGAHGRTRAVRALLPGYLFLQCQLDKHTHVDVLKTRGVVRILGERWDRLAPIPDDEVTAVRRMVDSDVHAFRYAIPQDGERVRIVDGPLKGLEGCFIRARPTQGLFVVSVTLLQRSVAAEVDADWVERA
jgi:transcription antitermination factor NusG